MECIINAGRYTATAKNRQACKFIVLREQLEEFKELVWKEMPSILEVLKETAPAYARAFELFYLKHQKNPKDDTFFFNTTSFLVIASKNPLDGGLAAANIENMAVAEGAGALYSGYMMRVIEASPVLKNGCVFQNFRYPAVCFLDIRQCHISVLRREKKGNIEWR